MATREVRVRVPDPPKGYCLNGKLVPLVDSGPESNHNGGTVADSQTPGSEPYLEAIAADSSKDQAAQLGRTAATEYLQSNLLETIKNCWEKRQMGLKYRLRRLGAVAIVASSLVGSNAFGIRDAAIELTERITSPLRPRPPIPTHGGFCFEDRGVWGNDTYPQDTEGKC